MGQDVPIGWDKMENGRNINMKAQVDSRQWDGGIHPNFRRRGGWGYFYMDKEEKILNFK